MKYTHNVAFAAFYLRVCHFFLSHEYVHMGHMNLISSILLDIFFSTFQSISLIICYRSIG